MRALMYMSDFVIPLLVFIIVLYGMFNKKNVYDDFVKGAKDGMKTVVDVAPTLIGLMIGVGTIRDSGLLEYLSELIGKLTVRVGVPAAIVPAAIIRMFSSSAATGLVLDLFKEYGTDSLEGIIASIMMGSTETIFYTMSVYFMAAKVSKTRWTLKGAMLSTIAGIVASILIGKRCFMTWR